MTAGTINVESYTSHVYVEWNLSFDRSKWNGGERKIVSPEFEVGNQTYSLHSHMDVPFRYFNFSLSRAGPPLGRPVKWWVGLKCPDGDYVHRQRFMNLCPIEECISLIEFDEEECFPMFSAGSEGALNFTLCFQVEVEESAEMFIHGFAEKMFPPSDGQIYEKECSCLKHVEWTLDFDWSQMNWSSPVFETGNQLFRFVFSQDRCTETILDLQLYWLGPSVNDRDIYVCSWAGLKRCDGTYHHSNATHKFLMKVGSGQELLLVSSDEIANYHLDRNKRLTFFFRVNEETGAEPCNFDRPETFPRGIGSIQNDLLSPYVLVQWTFAIDKINEVSSPVFMLDNQSYVLSFRRRSGLFGSKGLRLSLFRKGPFADRDVRFLGAVKRSDDLYQDLACGHGQLCLRRAADFWLFERSISELRTSEMWKDFTVELLLTCDESPAAGTLGFSTLCQAGEDLIDSPEMDPSFVVFKVEDMAFKIHKAPVLVSVPVFKRMLTNEWMESKTGVVIIEDCKAVVFKEFLELVEVGFERMPSVENALALFEVAHKYLLRRLKNKCNRCVGNNRRMFNIYDVLELGLAYEDEYFLRIADDVLPLSTNYMESFSFRDICSRYPDAKNKMMRRAADRR